MINDLELLWQTHDFVLEKIARLEDEFSYLLAQLDQVFSDNASKAFDDLQKNLGQIAFSINLPNSEDNINKDILAIKFDKTVADLNIYYNKQISTISDLIDYYKENKYSIPEERQVSVDYFEELKEVTTHLRDVLNSSHAEVKNMLDQI
tara:strand:- start:8107 stop:8553 length:447 start_codon:yes stop_codon:yes gene_type:complete